jgi:hypothetical protein
MDPEVLCRDRHMSKALGEEVRAITDDGVEAG